MIILKKDSVSINKVLIIGEYGESIIDIQDKDGLDYKFDFSNSIFYRCKKVANLIELNNTRVLKRFMYFITGNSKYIGRKLID